MPASAISRGAQQYCRAIAVSAVALLGIGVAPSALSGDPDSATDRFKTTTPIKHLIVIVGENRSFDHVYATYVPKHAGEKVLNLLSEGIVNADGSPGPNFATGHQFQITAAPNTTKYFISADLADKTLYPMLPA